MKKHIFLTLLFPVCLLGQKPKLVVGIVIDQMRYEMLERYTASFGNNGFKKLQSQGFSFHQCNYNYIPTYTGPGHATIFTGQNPKKHGIIANDWYIPKENRMVYCAEDTDVKPVGTKGESSMRSPKNLQTLSIADLIKQENGSKSFGISVKDRGAILPSGKNADGAFWLDVSSHFVSSTYYGKRLPQWLVKFNEQELATQYMQGTWSRSREESIYLVSDVDKRKCERSPLKKESVFPYDLNEAMKKKGNSLIKYTPYGNSLLTDAALKLIQHEQLGQGEKTDFLSISFSSTDYAGHAFGPRSQEVQDMYLRLDSEIERIINFLDANVGKGEYLLFLTADHGVVDCPETKNNHGKYIFQKDVETYLDSICMAEYGAKLISHMSNFQIWFDHELLEKMYLNVDDVAFVIHAKLQEYKGGNVFNQGWTRADLMECQDKTCEQFKKTYKEDLSGDAFFTLTSGYLLSGSRSGTSHGSGYSYDTHVPLLFYGWNIKPGTSSEPVVIQDIAPTVYDILNLTTEHSFDGKSLKKLMD